MPADIEKIKADIQKTSADAKARLEGNLAQAEAYLAELKTMKPPLVNRGVSSTMTLQEGGRDFQLMIVGRAHTDGDLFIYMPKEKVLVTGDAVSDWMPFFNDGYPEDWIQTVAALEKLDINQVVVGHGDPQPKSHLTYFRGYLTDLVGGVKKGIADKMPLPDMKTKLAADLAGKYEAPMSKHPLGRYRDRIDANVEQVYNKLPKA